MKARTNRRQLPSLRFSRQAGWLLVMGCLPLDEVNRNEYEDLIARIETLESRTGAGVITSAQLGSDSVTSAKLAPDSVKSVHVEDGTLTSADLANDAVTAPKIADNAVTAQAIAADSVGSSEVADGSLGSSDLADALTLGAANAADGELTVYDNDGGFAEAYLAQQDDEVGFIGTYYVNTGNPAVFLTNDLNSRLASVGVNNNDPVCCEAGMYVDSAGNGIVFGDTKMFVIPHPFEEEFRIVYASMEGPEAGAYVRGQATLVEGFAVVYLPEHFGWVVGEEGLTVHLTPQSGASLGLAVTQVTPDVFFVEELFGGNGTYDFFWRVEGVRRGHEDFSAIRPATAFAPAMPAIQSARP